MEERTGKEKVRRGKEDKVRGLCEEGTGKGKVQKEVTGRGKVDGRRCKSLRTEG